MGQVIVRHLKPIAKTSAFLVLLGGISFSQGSRAQPADTLTIGIVKPLEALHPLDAKTPEDQWLVGIGMSPLFLRDETWSFSCVQCEKIPSIENGLATIKSEGRRQTLKATWEISKEATWGDGTPVSAQDFRLAWEMAKSHPDSTDHNANTPHVMGYKAIAGFEFDAKNPRRFTVTYSESRHDFLNRGILYPIPSHVEGAIWKTSAGDWSTYRIKTLYKTAGQTPGLYNGAYLPAADLNGRSHLYSRRSDKRRILNPALPSQMHIKPAPNTEALLNDLVAGNIDLIPEGVIDHLSLQKTSALLKNDKVFNGKYRVTTAPGMKLELAAFNLRNPILIDRNIRWALAESIDRATIAKSLFLSDCCASTNLANPRDRILLKSAFNFSLGGPDPKSAANRMIASGWKRGGDGFWEKDGRKLQIKIEFAKTVPGREVLVNRLIQDWNRAGFLATSEAIAPEVFVSETTRKARFASIALYGMKLRPGEIPQSVLHSREIPTLQNGYEGQNAMGWSSQVVDSSLAALPWEHDEDSRQELVDSIYKAFINDLPLIPLYFYPVSAVAPLRLPGFVLTGHDYPSSTLIERWTQRPKN